MTTSTNGAFPFRTAKTIEVGGAPVLAQRITYVGELGYELYGSSADGPCRCGTR